MKKFNKIFITGATGSWGNELIYQLLNFNVFSNNIELFCYCRNEFNQVKLERKFKELSKEKNIKINYIIGDIRDFNSLKEATKNIDLIIHLAALKNLPIVEIYPEEGIKTNINGTLNIIKSAIENNVKKVVDVSTDKAVSPIQSYGFTKALGEKLFLDASNKYKENKINTQFSIVRGGNVMGSAGSVIPFWKEQLLDKKNIILTIPEMTRFFITLKDAITLLLTSIFENLNGDISVIKMKSINMKDLANILIKYYGNNNTKIEIIGNRSGEKIHELLISEYEEPFTYDFGEKYFVIRKNNKDYKLKKSILINNQYSSKDYSLSYEESEKLLKEGGFLNE